MTLYINDLCANGFIFLSGFQADADISDVVNSLGKRSLGAVGRSHRLTPAIADERSPNTYSGRYGCDEFPFHTDLAHHLLPPRYLLLRCIRGYREVHTLLIDGWEIMQTVDRSLLMRALVQPRRPRRGSLPLLSILDSQYGHAMLRWDKEYLRPASVAGEEATSLIAAQIPRAKRIDFSLYQEGDTLVVDNWRMLHARSAVPESCRDRIIERSYLEVVY